MLFRHHVPKGTNLTKVANPNPRSTFVQSQNQIGFKFVPQYLSDGYLQLHACFISRQHEHFPAMSSLFLETLKTFLWILDRVRPRFPISPFSPPKLILPLPFSLIRTHICEARINFNICHLIIYTSVHHFDKIYRSLLVL